MIRNRLLLAFVLISQLSFAQFGETGRKYVDTLCSPYFWGRGYTNEGCSRAAYYIANQFSAFGLQPVGKDYFQEFPMLVNTFPFELEMAFEGAPLTTGKDYQPAPESCGGKGTMKVVYADTITGKVPDTQARVALMMPKAWFEKFGKERRAQIIDSLSVYHTLVIETGSKLTWSVAGHHSPNPIFEVKTDQFWGHYRIKYKVSAVLEHGYFCNNVIGMVKGTQVSDSFLVVTAHYDHLGGMGESTFIPGANDNASGTAMLLSLAEYFKKNPPKYSVLFMAFAGEEAGLVGSQYYVKKPLVPLKKMKFLFNLDLMGTGLDGATVVNATIFPQQFERLKKINEKGNYLVRINERGEAANSDHYWFTKGGVPSFFMYLQDSNYTAYHNIDDNPRALPMSRFDNTCKLLIDFLTSF